MPRSTWRIRLAAVVAKCGLFCARTEARVKNRLYANDRNDPAACWPRGVLQKMWRHEEALEAHLASQVERPVLRRTTLRK